MRVLIEYTAVKSYNTVIVTATISKLQKEPQSKSREKLDHDVVKWIIFPEWIEQGLFLKNVENIDNLEKEQFISRDYFEVEKDYGTDKWNFKEIKVDVDETAISVSIDVSRVKLVVGYNSIRKKGNFQLHELIKKKELEKPVKRVKKVSKQVHSVYND